MKFLAAVIALCAVFAIVAAAPNPKPEPEPIYPSLGWPISVYGGSGASAGAIADAGVYSDLYPMGLGYNPIVGGYLPGGMIY